MTKSDLIVKIAEKAKMTKVDTERIFNAFVQAVEETLVKDQKLTLTGFGTFVVETRKSRKGRNPRTGDEIVIPESKVVKFRVGKLLKDTVQ
ncbi:DNA-binding protein HU [Desulfovibrionales bacterium]